MKESTPSVSSLSHQACVELEMLYAVLEEEAPYPWNPADPDAAAYYETLETAFASEGASSGTFESQWERLLEEANTLWGSHQTTLSASLVERFEARIPASVLRHLTQKVQEVANSNLTLIDQLVECAQSVVPGWAWDDLQVVARPLAMAMRDSRGEALEVTLRSVRETDWENLSDLEQARLSLVIARYALDQVLQDQVPQDNGSE